MVTGRIRFTERVLEIAEANGLGDVRYGAIYEIGDIACLPEPSCQRWISRGKAVRVRDVEEVPDGVQAETETKAEVSDAEPSLAGVESAAAAAPESDVVDDPAPVARPNRRPYRRRTQPDPE